MNIFKIVVGLRAIGVSFAIIGDLLVALGSALRSTRVDRSVPNAGSVKHVTGSSSSNGAENEEPGEVQEAFDFDNSTFGDHPNVEEIDSEQNGNGVSSKR